MPIYTMTLFLHALQVTKLGLNLRYQIVRSTSSAVQSLSILTFAILLFVVPRADANSWIIDEVRDPLRSRAIHVTKKLSHHIGQDEYTVVICERGRQLEKCYLAFRGTDWGFCEMQNSQAKATSSFKFLGRGLVFIYSAGASETVNTGINTISWIDTVIHLDEKIDTVKNLAESFESLLDEEPPKKSVLLQSVPLKKLNLPALKIMRTQHEAYTSRFKAHFLSQIHTKMIHNNPDSWNYEVQCNTPEINTLRLAGNLHKGALILNQYENIENQKINRVKNTDALLTYIYNLKLYKYLNSDISHLFNDNNPDLQESKYMQATKEILAPKVVPIFSDENLIGWKLQPNGQGDKTTLHSLLYNSTANSLGTATGTKNKQ